MRSFIWRKLRKALSSAGRWRGRGDGRGGPCFKELPISRRNLGNFKKYWRVDGCRAWKIFLIQTFSLGSEKPKEMQFFSFKDGIPSTPLICMETSSVPAGGLGGDALGFGAGAPVSPPPRLAGSGVRSPRFPWQAVWNDWADSAIDGSGGVFGELLARPIPNLRFCWVGSDVPLWGSKESLRILEDQGTEFTSVLLSHELSGGLPEGLFHWVPGHQSICG